MCSECAGSYEDGDEELEGHGGAREARRFRTAPGAGGANEWPDGVATIRTGSMPAHFASSEESYEVFVGADHILEVRVVRANVLVTPVLTSSAGRQPSREDSVRRCAILSDAPISRCAQPATGGVVNYKVIADRVGERVQKRL